MRLIYFSPAFARSYAQRPHFTVREWLRLGAEAVLWVEPYPCRLPRWEDLWWRKKAHDQGTQLDPRIEVLGVPALPVEPLPLGASLNRRLLWPGVWQRLARFAAQGPAVLGIGRPGALALAALRELQPAASFYEAMDNFPEFHRGLSRRAVCRYEDAIAAEADLVVASSSFLAEKFARRGLPVAKMLNACGDANPPAPSLPKPNAPVLGYVGCLGGWFDWPLLIRLAAEVPSARIELVGPSSGPLPRRLPGNVHLLPPCRHSEVGAHLARFSAGLIPFRTDLLTAGVDPIKYYEFRAAGLPILSSRFGEMALRGSADGVYFLDEGDNLRSVVSRALNQPADPAAAERFRQENTWQQRFAAVEPFRPLFARLAA